MQCKQKVMLDVLVFVNLAQGRVIWEEGTPIEKMFP